MDALGSGGFWWRFPPRGGDPRSRRPKSSSSSSESINVQGGGRGRTGGWSLSDFPLKQAAIAASLTLTGDTIAQVRDRLVSARRGGSDDANKVKGTRGELLMSSHWREQVLDLFFKDITSVLLLNHDWLRSLRMASYGFLLYGPGSYVWYQFLDKCMPKQTFINLSTKVLLNQIVLGPCVIAVIFAWNNLWLGKLSQLPTKYQTDALPTLLYGFRFWIPVTILNFGVVPLASRVAFMSTCSIFWNFYLSTTLSK